jgi:hypothetical protein
MDNRAIFLFNQKNIWKRTNLKSGVGACKRIIGIAAGPGRQFQDI